MTAKTVITAVLCLAGAAQAATAGPSASAGRKTVDDLVAMALGSSGLVTEAQGKVDEWRGRLAEVQSLYYPKLTGRAWVAPLFGIHRDSVSSDPFANVERDYTEWGPYFHLDATLAMPLYSFGRVEAGKDAAAQRLVVEEARARQTRNTVALEVRKLYYLHLYARSLQPALVNARKVVEGALTEAEEDYREGNGRVTNVNLQQLQYGLAEIDKSMLLAQDGEALSLAALKHTVGLPDSAELELADEVLPEAPGVPLASLAELLEVASRERPEWAQARHGKQAAISLESAERLANAPVLFAAGQLEADYAPGAPDLKNPYYFDEYNRVTGGVAVGVQFDLDPLRTRARAKAARGLVTQLEGLEKFAATGIPLEVRKAHQDAEQAAKLVEVGARASAAARRWMLFAASGYLAGTGESREVLEGLAAYLQARRDYLERLQGLHTARAYVLYATGRTGLEGRPGAAR